MTTILHGSMKARCMCPLFVCSDFSWVVLKADNLFSSQVYFQGLTRPKQSAYSFLLKDTNM